MIPRANHSQTNTSAAQMSMADDAPPAMPRSEPFGMMHEHEPDAVAAEQEPISPPKASEAPASPAEAPKEADAPSAAVPSPPAEAAGLADSAQEEPLAPPPLPSAADPADAADAAAPPPPPPAAKGETTEEAPSTSVSADAPAPLLQRPTEAAVEAVDTEDDEILVADLIMQASRDVSPSRGSPVPEEMALAAAAPAPAELEAAVA